MSDKNDRKEIVRLQEATNTSVVAFVLSLFMPPVGLGLGIKANREIKESDHTLTGSAFAVAAIWIGAIGTAIWAGLIALMVLTSVGSGDGGWGEHNMFGGHGFGNHSLDSQDGPGMERGWMGGPNNPNPPTPTAPGNNG